MANQEHLELLRQGMPTWNAWRNEHPEIQLDLNGADLSKTYFGRAILSVGGNRINPFINPFIIDLSNVDLSNANLSNVDLSNANLTYANLTCANLTYADLSQGHLEGATLEGTTLIGANLDGADLREAHLERANLLGAHFNGANLTRASLDGADLSVAHFVEANLTRASLDRAKLEGTYLFKTDFEGASLTRASLRSVLLSEANMRQVRVGGTTFGDVDLRKVKGLDTIEHLGSSTVGIDTILRSGGDIPEIFLRGTGATDTIIDYVNSLTQKPIEYYTCFISYSSKDDEFAKRLYADLQLHNVPCWFAPEDLRIGDKFWHRIGESIRLHDKLLIVLSEHSIKSTWVEREVMAALEKEQQQNTLVLFPIMLDEAVKQSSTLWASEIRGRHIGDFTCWKDYDSYQKAFTRLMRDLKADTWPKPQT